VLVINVNGICGLNVAKKNRNLTEHYKSTIRRDATNGCRLAGVIVINIKKIKKGNVIMKIYEIKIGIKNGEKTYWKTIGSIFTDDNAKIFGSNGKPATFVIDFPHANGIITKRESKEDYEARKARGTNNADQNIPNNTDNSNVDSGSDGFPF
jgi:hypothetical protein